MSNDPLFAAIRAVPMQCSTCDLRSGTEAPPDSPPCDPHT